ncbi:MAG: response regulator [Deltaproteobacteria bacterium]|nr:MAG: response regulator [Deltaproteobacteria bacterium]
MSKCIMVVDDSATVRESLRMTLSAAGYRILPAIDGVDALAKLAGERVDMLISDLNMPNLDGLGLLSAVRQNPAFRFTPFLMLTTELAEDKKRAGKVGGAAGWIVKPFRPDQMLKVVRILLGN